MNRVKINIETIKQLNKQEAILTEALENFKHLDKGEQIEEIIEQLYILVGFIERIDNYKLKVKVTDFLLNYSYIVVNIPDAEHYIESIIASESFNSNNEVLTVSFYLLSNVILKQNQPKKAIGYANMALFLANKTKNSRYKLNALCNLYMIYEVLGEIEEMQKIQLKITHLLKTTKDEQSFNLEQRLMSYLIIEDYESLSNLLYTNKSFFESDLISHFSTCMLYQFAKMLEKNSLKIENYNLYLFYIYNNYSKLIKKIEQIPIFSLNQFIFNSHIFKKRATEMLHHAIELQQGITLNTIQIAGDSEKNIAEIIEKLEPSKEYLLFYQTLLDEVLVIVFFSIQPNFQQIIEASKSVSITNTIIDEQPNERTLVKMYEQLNKLYFSREK